MQKMRNVMAQQVFDGVIGNVRIALIDPLGWKYFGKFSFENWRLLELWFYFPQVYESVTKVKTPQS